MHIKKAKICFISDHHVSVMKVSAMLSLRSSMSFILSLAQYLENTIKLKPPNLSDYLSTKHHSQLQIHLLSPKDCDYFEAWSDYLFELITKGKILRSKDEILFVTSITQEYFQQNLSNNSHFFTETLIKAEDFDFQTHLKQSLRQQSLRAVPKNGKKISIINFSTSVANLDKLRPKLHLQGLYAGQLYKFGDQWQSFRIINNHIPTVEQINRQDALILTGSSYSVTNMCPQIKRFGDNLLKVLSLNKKLKIIGTCFGHQLLCHLHGASVAKRNFVKGPKEVQFNKQIDSNQAPFLRDILGHQKKSYQLYEYHNDHVCSIPRGFLQVGSIQTCQIQSLISQDRRIWTCQFHPQYIAQYIQDYEFRSAKYNKSEVPNQIKQGRKDHHSSHEILRRAVRQFIDWNL